jgi:hypothetical protein
MKINKEAWRKMMTSTSLADLHERDLRDLPSNEDLKALACREANLVDHPRHYNIGKYEAIDVIEDWELDFHCGNAVKYIARHSYKESPKQDIEKAIWYLQRYLETLDENS